MPDMPPRFRPGGWRPPAEVKREQDQRRGTSRQRGYSAAWDKAAAGHRRNDPLCRYCELQKRPLAPATCVDHLYPHRTYADVFWRREWWVSSCDLCHAGFKQAVERQGKPALDALANSLGLPTLDPGGVVETPRSPRPRPAR